MNIRETIKRMSLEDKIRLCSGKNFWQTKEYPAYNIPSMFMSDGPHGVRKQIDASDMLGLNRALPSTCFPPAVTTASGWDEEVMAKVGASIAEEALNYEVGMVLGPGANLKRNPLCGRNFEYMSEDPYLAGKLAAAYIRGMEEKGISACLKHFACNSQELDRFVSDGWIDDRTLRELYLTAFEIAVKEGKPSGVMCSYPKIRGTHASDNKMLLTDILRTEWGFDGMVVTDWGAMNDRIEGFKAGCDLNMPGGSDFMEKDALKAVKNGTLSEEDIDRCAENVLRLVMRAYETMKSREGDLAVSGSTSLPEEMVLRHHQAAKEAALSGAVLLKNEDKILPLRKDQKVAVIGYMAEEMRYQGAGSSHINPAKLTQPLEAIKLMAGEDNITYAAGCDKDGAAAKELLQEVKKAAKASDIAVVFAGLPDRYESEGFDRDDMQMPEGHVKMIEAAAEANPNTVVVLLAGSAVECPWADKVKAVLYMGLPGQAGGEAASELLYGVVSPSGKLAESWACNYSDVPSAAFYDKTRDALYQEGIYVGYRYYDKAGVKVRWPFGYGLSYAAFEYSDLKVSENEVTVTVTNTGSMDASEVVMMYVASPEDSKIHRPVRELKGFKKVFLKKGESTEVVFTLDERSFAIWDDGWKVQKGCYSVQVADLKAEIEKDGCEIEAPEWQKGSWYETMEGTITREAWEKMIGRTYTAGTLKKGQFTMDNTIVEMKDYSLIMKIMFKAVESTIAKDFGGVKDYNNPEFRMLMVSSVGGPIRNMQINAGMKGGVFAGMVEMANGHFFKGILKMIKG